jgi:quinol monooxygenase YgiN
MFARLVRFSLGPGKQTVAQALANDLVPAISELPGCRSAVVFADAGDGECGIFVLWDSQENADAAAGKIRPRLDEHLRGHLQSPPDARLFEVLAQ